MIAVMEKYTRLTDILLRFWDEFKEGPNPPAEKNINSEYFGDMWANCFLAKVVDEGKYKYSYLGDNLIEACGDDFEKDEVEYLISNKGHRLVEKFDEAVKTGKPVSDDGEFVNSAKLLIKYRQMILPIKNSQGKIGYIFGGMRWKAF